MKLSDLAEETGAELIGGDAEVRSLCTDSRVAGEGDLFFCFYGTKFDSHLYAEEAELRGAAALMAEHDTGASIPQLIVPDGREGMARAAAAFYGHPERKLKLVGITGTNGKTTTSYMLYEILRAAGRPAGVIGTLGARYRETKVPPALTTPDPVALFSLLADMANAGVEVVVMEVSAHALALKKTAPILFDVAVFTNFTQDHLDFFGDMEAYAAAKRKLFSPSSCREGVVNSDDPFSQTLTEVPVTSYGLDCPADAFAIIESEEVGGSRVLLNIEDSLAEAEIPMAGRFNLYNALAAATAARKLGVDMEAIARGLSAVQVEGRLERAGSYRGAQVFIDFAHTPDGLKKALTALRPFAEGRLLLLFGCGGNRDREKRPIMGKVAAEYADLTVLTSDNPRYEDPAEIISEIEGGLKEGGAKYVAIEERERATEYAVKLLKKGDILLIAGKGGEHEQEIMGIKYSYNDKAVVKSLLEKL